MKIETQEVTVQRYKLHRIVVHPEPSVPVCAEAIFYHGQGGYADRYPEVLEVFTKRGIRCIITDLPGHGRSPGRRGHAGNETLLDDVIRASFEIMNSNLPYGVMGHSMGGLLTLRHLVLAGKGLLPEPSFSWVSSPLVDAGAGQSLLNRKLAAIFAPILPWVTVSTGVTSAMCRVVVDDVVNLVPKQTVQPLWHSRVSLGWGYFLLRTSEWLAVTASDVPKYMPLLMTQGSEDSVCPPSKSRSLFDQLSCEKKSYFEIEGALHEPFSGAGSESLYIALEKWLDELTL